MNPAMRTNGHIALSILRARAQIGRAVIDTLGRRMWESSPAVARSPIGMRAALRVAGTLHRTFYVRSGGKIGGRLRGGSVLLLTTTGRKSGKERTLPLFYLHDGDNIVLVASAAGAPQHPAWYLNLLANPRVRIQQRGVTRTMEARSAEGSDRARLWQRIIQRYPVAAEYQRRTGREFPVVMLRPIPTQFRTAAHPVQRCNGMSLVHNRVSAVA